MDKNLTLGYCLSYYCSLREYIWVITEDIYKQLISCGEDVGLATVYRVLTQFEAAGIVKRHNFEDGHSVYEIAEEEHHDHMICLETGTVNEFNDELIEQRQKDIAEEFGYELVDHTMVLYVKPKK